MEMKWSSRHQETWAITSHRKHCTSRCSLNTRYCKSQTCTQTAVTATRGTQSPLVVRRQQTSSRGPSPQFPWKDKSQGFTPTPATLHPPTELLYLGILCSLQQQLCGLCFCWLTINLSGEIKILSWTRTDTSCSTALQSSTATQTTSVNASAC